MTREPKGYRYTPEEIGELNQIIDTQRDEIERLRAEVAEWKERWGSTLRSPDIQMGAHVE